MTDAEKIAAFLRERGATKLPAGTARGTYAAGTDAQRAAANLAVLSLHNEAKRLKRAAKRKRRDR